MGSLVSGSRIGIDMAREGCDVTVLRDSDG